MSSINEYIHDDSDCETVYSFEEVEEEENNEEEDFDEEYYEDFEDEYYEPEYIQPEEEIKKKFCHTINTKIPQVNPWSFNNNNNIIKSMDEILKEEEENKKIEDEKQRKRDELLRKRKERFRNSRSSFHFKNEPDGIKRKLLSKK